MLTRSSSGRALNQLQNESPKQSSSKNRGVHTGVQNKDNRNGGESHVHPGNTSRKHRSGKDVKNKAVVDKRRSRGKELCRVHNGS